MEEFIAPVIFLIVLFVGFGLAHRRGQRLLAVPVAHLVLINLSAQKKMNNWGQNPPG